MEQVIMIKDKRNKNIANWSEVNNKVTFQRRARPKHTLRALSMIMLEKALVYSLPMLIIGNLKL